MDAMQGSWMQLLALGAFHGINPGMGWLFAVALGMQERRRAAVWRAMMPLAAGHTLAIASALAIALLLGVVVPLVALQWAVGGALLTLGLWRLFRHAHPRWVGMQVGLKDLTVWSFLMASAHGAGLMVLPIVLASAASVSPHHHHLTGAAAGAGAWPIAAATLVHSVGYLSVSAAMAVLVFEKFGVGLLRKAWFNLDLVWAIALMAASIATFRS